MSNESFLSDIREAVKSRIEADPYFAGIEVLTERLKDLESELDQKLAVIGGIAVVLVTPSVGGVMPNVPGANFSEIALVARVLENLDLNDTGKEALDVAIYLHALLSQSKPDQLSAPLKPMEPSIRLSNDPTYLGYDVAFSTEGGMNLSIPRLAAVAADTADLDAIALSHATPGAAIFYTLDGTQAAPRNPSATLYTAPFSAAPGTKLRARAWLAGYHTSADISTTL